MRSLAVVEPLDLVIGLIAMLVANLLLLRRALAPVERLVERMRTVDLLQPGQRLVEEGGPEVAEVVAAFNQMLERLEVERRESSRRALAAQEAERLRVARHLHDEVGQVLTGVLLQLDALATADRQVEVGVLRRQRLLSVARSRRCGGSRKSCGRNCSNTWDWSAR